MTAGTREFFVRFGVVFLVCLFIELNIWLSIFSFADIELWGPGITSMKDGAILDVAGLLPVHPNAPFLFGSAFIASLGLSSKLAMQVFMATALAAMATFISYLCYTLRPRSYWWVLVLVLLVPHKLMLDVTPPTALAAVFSVASILLILKFREDAAKNSSHLALLGAFFGILLATRLDTGIMMILISFPYLWLLAGKRALMAPGFALLYFAAFDPFLWVNPFEHAEAVLSQVQANRLTTAGFGYRHHILLLSVTGALLASAYCALMPRLSSVPRDFFLWLYCGSFVICAFLLLSPYHPFRYFFPLMMVWEVFLMLLMLELAAGFARRWVRPIISPEFAVFLWIFLDRVPPVVFMFVHNVAPRGIPGLLGVGM